MTKIYDALDNASLDHDAFYSENYKYSAVRRKADIIPGEKAWKIFHVKYLIPDKKNSCSFKIRDL